MADAEGAAPWRARRLGIAVLLLGALALPLLLRVGLHPIAWTDLSPAANTLGSQIVWRMRLPRVVLAWLVGASLAVAGALMQALTRNALAGPSLMGLGPGAALAMLTAVIWAEPTPRELAWISFAGAAGGAALVLTVASATPRGATPERLVLSGAVVGSSLTAITGITVLQLHLFEMFWHWTAGGLGPSTWAQVLAVLPLLLPGMGLAVVVSRPLTVLLAGADTARSLGMDVGRVRALTSIAVLLLAGGAVAAAGPVGFVGILVPNICRRFVGGDVRRLLPLVAVAGGALVTVADAITRLRPGGLFDLPLGAVTAFLGAPAMIAIARRGLRCP